MNRSLPRRLRNPLIALLTAGSFGLTVLATSPAHASVSPSSATFTINAGSSTTETKTVGIPAVPPSIDIEIAIDTTGSMGGTIAQARSQAVALVNKIKGDFPSAEFSVVQFKDVHCDMTPYQVVQPMTVSATDVQNAINTLTADGGCDFPEAYNTTFANSATPSTGGAIGWRDGSRKVVVVMGDAVPHAAEADGYDKCTGSGALPAEEPVGTKAALTSMRNASRTLFMVGVQDGIMPCYQQLAAAEGYAGSTAFRSSDDFPTQIDNQLKAATSTVNEVHLTVSSASPAPAAASWISFSPATSGPYMTPATTSFTVTISVPAGTTPGTYSFDLEALADGADIGHQALTVIVPNPVLPTKIVAQPALLNVSGLNPLALTLTVNSFAARLTTTTGTPVANKTVTMSVGTTAVCSAKTNANGVATCGGTLTGLLSVVLGLGYNASFAGDAGYLASTGHGPLVSALGIVSLL